MIYRWSARVEKQIKEQAALKALSIDRHLGIGGQARGVDSFYMFEDQCGEEDLLQCVTTALSYNYIGGRREKERQRE